MSVKQRTVKLQNLNSVDTFTQETGAVSEYFNVTDFPDELSTGRSSFLILGSQYLRQDVSIKIEILDNQGNPVYIEPVYSYEEGNGVRVSVEIYQDISAGAATLTILGEVDPTTVDYDIPPEFIDVYNVKYTKSFIINKDIPNTRPIRFFKRPQISAKEVFKPKLNIVETTQGNLTQTVGLVVGKPVANTEGRNFSLDDASYGEVPNYTDQTYGSSPIGNQSPNLGERYTFTIVGAQFSSSMQGGTLKITDPQATPYFTTQSFHSTVAYSSSIVEVLNKNTVAVQKPFGIFNSSSGDFEISAMGESLYEINYPRERTFFTSSVDFKSFAEITVHTMRTFSGDVNRVAAYVKNNGPYGNWTKIADTPIESPELLVDHNSTTSTNRLGFFKSDSIVTSFYDATSGLNGIASSTTLQTASDPEYMANSLFISGSGVDMLADDEDQAIKIQLKPQYSSSFVAGNEYVVRAKLIADNTYGEQDTIKAVFHMSGSAFNMSSVNGQHGYGEPIGRVKFDNASRQLLGQTEPEFEATFSPQRTGTGILQIRFTGGHWHVADLSIRPASETNFSPEIIKLVAPIPTLAQRPDNLDFAVEFYDVNNNKAQTVVTTQPNFPDGITFQGENLLIAGNDNTVEGSLFLGGDTTGSGIQMGGVASTLPETGGSGATGSGFIRSVQYQGFTSASLSADNTGWMIYSGSVLPDSGDNYAGVGLELVGQSGSLRFSTIPSRFEVVADAFFVGSTNTQFISGSQGIIEISSSAFHLSSSGDVIISGSITATEGSIAGWNIVGDKLSGSNATLDAGGAALYKSDEGPETNPYNGYYIDFTPTQANPYYVRFGPDFAVSSSGRLIASGAVIEGTLTASTGFIGNWVIGSNQLFKETSGKFTGMSVAGDTRFFAGATALAGSGSAPFNVKATGDITGSSVLFTGGKIGGFELTNSILRNTDNTVELSSILPGLKIKDGAGVSRVEVKSGSLSTVGGGSQYVENNSFEDQVGSLSAGRNFVSTITSWSFVEVGGVNISLTDRNGYVNEHKAVSGRVTLDVVVPSGASNYTTTNTYELTQIVTQSISAGDTLSFSSVARFSSSFSGKGKDRGLGPQYFRAEYSASGGGGWIPFLPAAEYTASNGYGEYFLGSGQYNSFGASAEVPVAAEYIRLVLTGSINDDSGFSVEKPLFAADKGTVNSDISGRTFTKQIVTSTSPEYPETEITFDNFSLRSNTRKVEMTQEGLLIYNSEDSFLKMTGAGIEFRGGSGLLSAGTSINRESFTNDSQIAGTLAAPSLQPYAANPEPIGGALSPGNVADYARGNHVHTIPSAAITNVITGSLIPSASITSLSVTHFTGSNVSSSGTGSFGQLLIAGQPVATGRWAGGSNIYYNGGNVGIGTDSPGSLLTLEGSSNPTQRIQNTTNNTYLDFRAEASTVLIRSTGAHSMRFDVNQTERMRIDTDGDVGIGSTNPQQKLDVVGNIAVTGTVDGRDLSTDGSKLDGIEASAKDDQTITAGTGLTGGGTGDVTLNVIGGTGITANANNITTTDSEIVHDNLSGFVANEHIDHSGVTITAGAGLTGGGTIQATRTLNIGQGTGIAVSADSIATNDSEIVHDNLSGFVANEHIDHSGVSITAGAGLTGGGDITATRTLNIGAGTGVTVNANDIAIGQAIGTGNSPTFAGLAITNNITVGGTVDGRDVASDGSKLDGIESGATADQSNAEIRTAVEAASDSNVFTDADHSKLNAIEASADVTDATNVQAAGAVMDSEVTDLDGIKSLTVPNNTTISTFGASLIDDAAASNARTTLGLGSLATLSSIDISSNTNLVAGTNITLSGDTLNVDDAFLKNNANDTTSGTITAAGLITSGNISGSAISTGSFGRLDAHKIVADGSGTPLEIQGTSGSLFSVTDNFSGSLMSVSDISGIPILEVFEDDRVVMGKYSAPAMTITGSFVGVGTSTPTRLIHLAAASPAIMWEDTDVSGLKHQIIAGGNTGLEYSADMNNTTTGYHRWDIGGSVAMKLIEGGSLRIGDGTNPSYKLDVQGTGRFTDTLTTVAINASGNISSTATSGNNTFNSSILIASGKNLFFDGGSNTYIKEHSADDLRVVAGGNTAFDFLPTGAGVPATAKLYLDGGSNTYITEGSADVISFYTGGTLRFDIDNTGNIIIKANDKHLYGLTSGNATIQLIGVRGDNYVEIGHSGYGVVTGTGNWALDGADNMTVNANAYFGEYLYHSGDTDTFIRFTTDDINIQAGGVNFIDITEGGTNEVTFNEEGADVNVRMEGDSDTHLFFLDAGNDKIGIGTSAPGVAKLNVFSSTAGGPFLYVGDGTPNNDSSWDANIMLDSNQHSRFRIENRGDNKNLQITSHTGYNPAIFAVDSATAIRMGVGGTTSLTIGTSPYLTVHGNTTISGNITVTGTVDGRDLATDGSKLDGIEANAKNDQTITAGSGLTGGGTGDVTLNVGAGTGIDVAADAISVDVSDFMTNGSNNRVLTATGTDAMNAEANLIFDGTSLGIGASPTSITNHKLVEIKNTASNGRATLALTANASEYSNLYMGDADDIDVGGIQYYHGTNVMDFYVGGSSRLHINNSGNVGIGDSVPQAKLHVELANHDDAVGFYNGATNLIFMRNESNTGRISIGGTGGYINLESSNSRNSYINTSANFGIGTASPSYKLDVNGTGRFTGKLNLDAAESLELSGIRGQAVGSQTSEFIQLYERVSIGNPSGWGHSSAGAPQYGLSVYGSVQVGRNGSGVLQMNGTTVIDASRNISNVVNITTSGYISTTSYVSLTGGLNTNGSTITLDTGETLSASGGYVIADGNSGFIIRDDGSNKFIANGNTFRGDSNNAQYLGSSSIRFANIYGVLGNFSSNISLTGALIGTGDLDLYAGGGTKIIGLSTSTISLLKDVTIADGESIGTSTYASGFAGSGFRIDQGITEAGKTSAAIDNLTVRGTMSIYELQIQQVRATNGNLFISSTGKADTVVHNGGVSYTVFPDSGSSSGHGFAAGDIIRMQRFDNTGTGGSVTVSDLHVQSVAGTGSFTANLVGNTTAPAKGFEYVRLGSSTNADRRGGIYLTADDSNAPFIDVFDNITSHADFNANTGSATTNASSPGTKVRIGKLTGITSANFGAIGSNVYGLWASGSVYLEGAINATSGLIGGWNINDATLTGGSITLDKNGIIRSATNFSSGNGFYLDATTFRVGTANQSRFQWDNTNVEIYNSSNVKLVSLGATNTIAGWEVTQGTFQYNNAAGSIALDATNQQVSIHTGSINTNRPKVVMGKLPRVGGSAADDRYGFGVFTSTVDADITNDDSYNVLITRDKAKLAGWDLIPGNIQSNNTFGSVRLSSTKQALTIWTGSINEAQPKLVLGKLPLNDGTVDSPYGFAVFSGTGTVSGSEASASVLITANKARLAGWELIPGRLSSGTVADINGNQASIALGTGATTATGTPTDGLFFVSASANPVFYVGSTFSYVNNELKAAGWTLNAASFTSPGNTITIHSTSKYIAIGTGGYKGADTIYLDGANSRMSVGPNFYYESSTLTVAGWTINSDTITSTNTILGLGYISLGSGTSAYNSANRIYIDGNNTRMSLGTGFRYTSNALTIDGNATIAGWTISSNNINKNNVKLSAVSNAEGLYVKKTSYSSTTAGGFLGLDGGVAKFNVGNASKFIKFNGTHFTVDAGNFSLDASGNMTATSATLSGTVTAGAGNIGGFGIGANSVTSSNNNFALSSTQASMSLGVNKLKLAGGTDSYIAGGGHFSSPFQAFNNDVTGFVLGMEGSDVKFELNDADNGVGMLFDSSDGTLSVQGAITANTITANSAGTIAGWTVNSGSLTKNNVSLQQDSTYQLTGSSGTIGSKTLHTNVIASGLVIRNGETPILSVVSSSQGQTPITALTGSAGTTAPDSQWVNNSFEDGDVSTWTVSNSSWTNWAYFTGYSSVGSTQAYVSASQTYSAGSTALLTSTIEKKFDVSLGTRISIGAKVLAEPSSNPLYSRALGDITYVNQSLVVEIHTSNSTVAQNGSYTLHKTTTFQNTTAVQKYVQSLYFFSGTQSIKLKFIAKAQATKAPKSSVELGAWAIGSVSVNPINASRGAGAKPTRTKPLVELSQDGLLVFSDEENFLRVNEDDGFTLKGALQANDLTVEGSTVLSGSVVSTAELLISGSIKFTDGVFLGVGWDSPESRIHIIEAIDNDISKFQTGITPTQYGSNKSIAGVKSVMLPYTGATSYDYLQAAFLAPFVASPYRVVNCGFYSEAYHGVPTNSDLGYTLQGPHTTLGYQATGSVALNKVQGFAGSKRMWGLDILQITGGDAAGADKGDQDELQWAGVEIRHDLGDFRADDGGITNESDGSSAHKMRGFYYECSGSYQALPTIGTTSSHLLDSARDGGYTRMVGIGARNMRSGTYGQKAGWGLFISGSEWPSCITGQLGIGDAPNTGIDNDSKLHIVKNSSASDGIVNITSLDTTSGTYHSMFTLKSYDSSRYNYNYYIKFMGNSQTTPGTVGSINSEVVYSTFTGAHVSQRPSGSTSSGWRQGSIVKSTGNIISSGSGIGLAWPEVDIATAQKDKTVIGVYDITGPAGHDYVGLDNTREMLSYNAVGEGKMLVTDSNGTIENGDYICSSNRAGHGEKQDEVYLANFTVAKATETIDFSNVEVDSELGFKSTLICCTYHCG